MKGGIFMAKTKAEPKAKETQPKPVMVIQPDGTSVPYIPSESWDKVALQIYLGNADVINAVSQEQKERLGGYIRQIIIQLDMPANGIELNEYQKQVRDLWFKDSTEDDVREQVLGTERYNYWKQTGSVEPPPKKEKEEEASSSPASENKGEAASTLNIETNIHVNNGEDDKEENTMFNQTNNNQAPNQQAQPNQQQNGGNIITDAIGAVDNFTDHWYGKAAIAGAAAAGTYYLMNRSKNSDPDYSSAGDDAMTEFGGNFF